MPNPIQRALGVNPAALVTGFDWAAHGVDRRYVVLTTGRSGSTWLAHLLTDSGLAGAPDEFFNETAIPGYLHGMGVTDPADYLAALVDRHTVNRTFGLKINPQRLLWLADYLDLRAVFADTAWIWMTRDDFVAQAFSFVKARHSGHWHTYTDTEPAAAQAMPADDEWLDEQMWKIIGLVIGQEQAATRFFTDRGIRPLALTYEELAAYRSTTLLDVLDHIGIDTADALPALRDLEDRTVRNQPDPDGRLDDFVTRHLPQLQAIHADRAGIDVAALPAS